MTTPPPSEREPLAGRQGRLGDQPVYHVVHDVGGRWAVQRDGAVGFITRTDTLDEALALARKLAAAGGVGHVIVHRPDGSLQTAYQVGDELETKDGLTVYPATGDS
jgi:hypothetical protein